MSEITRLRKPLSRVIEVSVSDDLRILAGPESLELGLVRSFDRRKVTISWVELLQVVLSSKFDLTDEELSEPFKQLSRLSKLERWDDERG